MKKYFILLFLSIIFLKNSILFADGTGCARYELFIGTRYTDNFQLTVSVDRIGVSWDESYDLCECCNGYNFQFDGSSIKSDAISEWWDGFNFICDPDIGDPDGQYGGLVTYSVYKISTWYQGSYKYFYLDYRDSRYVNSYVYPYDCCIMDIFIVFDGNDSTFAYSVGVTNWPFTQINSNGSIKKVWDMFPGVPDPPEQVAFEKEFNLTIGTSNNHP